MSALILHYNLSGHNPQVPDKIGLSIIYHFKLFMPGPIGTRSEKKLPHKRGKLKSRPLRIILCYHASTRHG